jgi:hypothetical protein
VDVILLTPAIPGVVTREKDEIEVRPGAMGDEIRGYSYHGYAEYWLSRDALPAAPSNGGTASMLLDALCSWQGILLLAGVFCAGGFAGTLLFMDQAPE